MSPSQCTGWAPMLSNMLTCVMSLFSLCLSDDEEEEDLSSVTPLLVAFYILCYTPFTVSEVTHTHNIFIHETANTCTNAVCMYTNGKPSCICRDLHTRYINYCTVMECPLVCLFTHQLILLGRVDLSPAPDWLRTLSSVMSYLDCGLNPLIYCSHLDFREAGLALLWTNKKVPSEPILTGITKMDLWWCDVSLCCIPFKVGSWFFPIENLDIRHASIPQPGMLNVNKKAVNECEGLIFLCQVYEYLKCEFFNCKTTITI